MKKFRGVAGACALLVVMSCAVETRAQGEFVPPEAPFGPQRPTRADRAQWDDVRRRMTQLEARFNAKTAPASPANRALLKFNLDQARLWLGYYDSDLLLDPPSALRFAQATMTRAEFVSQATTDASWAVANRVFVEPRTRPQIHERAYFAPDGSSQPFWVYLPPNYSPRKKYPLAVMLHGYTSDITKINPWLPGPDGWVGATRRDMILVVPYGRRNSDFVNIGEDDTYAVKREVERLYSIDTTRTALFGVSMGGTGALVQAAHRPGVWNGVASMSARTDLYAWAKLKRAQVPAWKQPLYDADDPVTLASNLRGTPLLIMHGEKDSIVPVLHPRRLVSALRKHGVSVDYEEIPQGAHTSYLDAVHLDFVWAWISKLPPIRVPREIRFRTFSPSNNRAHWAQIDEVERDDHAATLNARLSATQLDVQIGNVRAFTLTPKSASPVTLRVNGREAGTFAAGDPIRWPLEAARTDENAKPRVAAAQITPDVVANAPDEKRVGRIGPIKEVYRAPFLLVYGRETELDARRFALEWDAFADGTPPLKRDTDVTPADKDAYNLILFGTRDSNELLREIAPKLPIELLDANRVRFGKGVQYFDVHESLGAKSIGLQMCYPSPWSRERMIVVQSGLPWGYALPVNHKFDLLPDYIVYTDEIDRTDLTNRAQFAGWFTRDWKLPSAR